VTVESDMDALKVAYWTERQYYASHGEDKTPWLRIASLRETAGLPRARFDEALRKDPDVEVMPESNQKTLTHADRESSLRIGGQEVHLVAYGFH